MMDTVSSSVTLPRPSDAVQDGSEHAAALGKLAVATTNFAVGVIASWSELSLGSQRLAAEMLSLGQSRFGVPKPPDGAEARSPAFIEDTLDANLTEAIRLQARMVSAAAEQWRQFDASLRKAAQQFAGDLYEGHRKLLEGA